MNPFKIVLENVILLSFPILIYLVYLFTNKGIKSKELYFKLVLISSIYLVRCFGSNILVSVIVLNSIVILLYLNNNFVYSNIVGLIIMLMFMNNFNNIYILIISYILFGILYVLVKKKHLFLTLSVLSNILVYTLWIYKYNNIFFDIRKIITIGSCYMIVTYLLYLIYIKGNMILKDYMEYRELKKEEQIKVSLFKITHEIKNPIAVCKGYLDMINTKDSKQVERFIPIIKSEIERILVLLEDFLSINKCNYNFDIMDINMLIEEIVYKLNNNENIKIGTNLYDDEVYINGDYNRLNQMLLNIVKNGIESIKGSGNIQINSYSKGKNYIVTIEDDGIGMDRETLTKMREPFFTTKARGTGLGVSLIYEVASLHNIKISYESKVNKGTKVILKFKCI